MYEERRAFPFKWIALGVLIIVSIIGFVSYRSYLQQKKDQEYRDVIERIKKAAKQRGEERKTLMEQIEEECVSLETLMTEKSKTTNKFYLISDSKKEPVIYNPKTNEKMTGKVYVVLNEDDIILVQYMFDEICVVNYEEKIKLAISNQTTHGFVATIESPEGLTLNAFEYKIDDEEFFKHDSPTYRFDGLLSGNHKIVVKVTDYLNSTYERTQDVILDEVKKPELVYNESTYAVDIVCPESEDEEYWCAYTIDSENWSKVTADNYSYIFKENGQLIAMATDGYNKSEKVVQEVTVQPTCIDSKWSTCTGCTAPCGSSCTGTQTSNCGNTRSCTLYGPCISSSSQTAITYAVTVKASNGTPGTQSATVPSGYNRVFTVKPATGYEYGSVSCSAGSATYSTRTNQLTVSKVSSARTCNVYFTKKVEVPTYYTVKFVGFSGQTLDTKQVLSGKTVSPITAPTVPGYTFISWTRNGVTYNFSTKVTSNIILNAKYEANRIAVSFDSSGGTPVTTQYIISGQPAYRPFDPTKQGYRFDNWYLGTSVYNFSTPISSPITLKAKWFTLVNKTITMDGTSKTASAELPNFRGIHQVTGTCSGTINYTISGNIINISIYNLESCKVYVLYY